MKKFLAILILSIHIVVCKASYPLVRNFTRADYEWGAQNWDIRQDALGRMWFANRNGLLMFDGNLWHRFYLDNYASIRDIAIDTDRDCLWAAGSETFGYFKPSPANGALHFVSLADSLRRQGGIEHIAEVWAVHLHGHEVWFRADNYMIKVSDREIIPIRMPSKTSSSAFMGNNLVVACENNGLWTINANGKPRQIMKEEEVADHVVAMAPFQNGKLLLLTSFTGAFVFDGSSLTPFATEYRHFLSEGQGFSLAIRGSKIAFGTVRNGALIIDSENLSKPTYINQFTGLQNNTVLASCFDSSNNLWLGLDNGIDYVLFNTPVRSLLGHPNTLGSGYASLRYGDNLLLGTNQGLYAIPDPDRAKEGWVPPTSTSLLKGQIWNLTTVEGDTFVTSDRGLYLLHGLTNLEKIENIPGTIHLLTLKDERGVAIAATYDGFYLLTKTNGLWRSQGRISGFDEASGQFIEDSKGNLWLPHWLKGIYRLRLASDKRSFTLCRLYNSTRGLPTNSNNSVALIDNNIYITTDGGGFYAWDEKTDSMVHHEAMSERIPQHRYNHTLQTDEHSIWTLSYNHFWLSHIDYSGNTNVDSVTFNMLRRNIIPGWVNIGRIDSERVMFPNLDGFYELNIAQKRESAEPAPYISAIYCNNDSLVYFPDFKKPGSRVTIDYKLNTVRFYASMPEYAMEKPVLYSYWLKGYDAEEKSVFTPHFYKEYTHLDEGHYTLVVKALNQVTGHISETKFELRILPPWYRSTAAYVIYIILSLILLSAAYVAVRNLYLRSLQRMKKQKEAEYEALQKRSAEEALRKDHEISKLKNQQLEEDVKRKSEELSNTTMNVVRKNEILKDISDRLDKHRKHLEEENASPLRLKDVDRLQKLISENISHDDDWKQFTANFDIVYTNFTQRLRELHPTLTVTDTRVCCYLRMGLTSKDIAPLMNISYRSVEMTRYRLRKKLELSRETNLSDYLQTITDPVAPANGK